MLVFLENKNGVECVGCVADVVADVANDDRYIRC